MQMYSSGWKKKNPYLVYKLKTYKFLELKHPPTTSPEFRKKMDKRIVQIRRTVYTNPKIVVIPCSNQLPRKPFYLTLLERDANADSMEFRNFPLKLETVFPNVSQEPVSWGSNSLPCKARSSLSKYLLRLESAMLMRLRAAFVCMNFVRNRPARIDWSALTSSEMKQGKRVLLKRSRMGLFDSWCLSFDNWASWYWREKFPTK